MGTEYHVPVLLREAVDLLVWDADGLYVDATVGGGGHAAEILRRLGPGGKLVGIDRDPEAVRIVRERFEREANRFVALQGNFADLKELLSGAGVDRVSGVLFDLGVSSHQLDSPQRGFSFDREGPLDLRMDPTRGRPASEVVNRASEEELQHILWQYGEEPHAARIARQVVRRREQNPIRTTADLAAAVKQSVRGPRIAKTLARVFQALRIYVNDELSSLERGLQAALGLLIPSGRLVVISYHSLEDRIVKTFLRQNEPHCVCPREAPICTCGKPGSLRVLTRKPIRPSPDEIARNPRARSARLRAAEKLAEG